MPEEKNALFLKKNHFFCLYITKMLYLCSVIQNERKATMNWNEVKKYAEKRGWEFERHGKKHDIYRHPNKPYKIQIERHWSTEVRDGLLKTLLKRIGE